ncbi:MAG: AAA family ATPase [Promethearchaeota archaeon]
MIEQEAIFRGLEQLISLKKIVSVAGSSGTGKTTLALQLVGNLITQYRPYKNSCIWIQASEIFPNRRLNKIFEFFPEKLYYLKEHMFITPKKRICKNYHSQTKIIENIVNGGMMLPPGLKFVVIDNISHHLRYQIFKADDINRKISILNDFFNSYLLPLILLCMREDIILILIHEVSYDLNLAEKVPFLYKLYERIDSLIISLTRYFITNDKKMSVVFNGIRWIFKYRLEDEGFFWLDNFKVKPLH